MGDDSDDESYFVKDFVDISMESPSQTDRGEVRAAARVTLSRFGRRLSGLRAIKAG